MNAPTPGLRPLFNRTNGVAKVAVAVPAGDVVHVSDEVAAQLLASGAFREGDASAPADAHPVPVLAIDEVRAIEGDEPDAPKARKPRK